VLNVTATKDSERHRVPPGHHLRVTIHLACRDISMLVSGIIITGFFSTCGRTA